MTASISSATTTFENALDAALRADRVVLGPSQLKRFARELQYSQKLRARGPKRLPPPKLDILNHIEEALHAEQRDEAIWRVFLAAHFGRLSASLTNGNAESAGLFLYGFGEAPLWTWAAVSKDNGAALEAWLRQHPRVWDVLRFGNHRKHENPRLDAFIRVIRSFLQLSRRFNGPANIIKAPGASSPFERFDILFNQINLQQFNRLGKWDFIDLLAQLRLTDAEPKHCYLKGSSGPLDGARLIWGNKDEDALNAHTSRLAQHLQLSCFVLEDALCNYSKEGDSCCGEPHDDGTCSM